MNTFTTIALAFGLTIGAVAIDCLMVLRRRRRLLPLLRAARDDQ
jgi:hypothetical protein